MTDSEPPSPRRIILAGILAVAAAGVAGGLVSFRAATAPETESFRFSRDSAFAAGEAARLKGFLAPAVQDDRLSVIIVGHSGLQGESAASLALSEKRAASAQGIALEMGIPPERVSATGVGRDAPLPRKAGQSEDAHEAMLARVEVTLQMRR